MHRDHLIMVYVQLSEVRIVVLRCGLDGLQVKVALDELFKFFPVNLSIVLAIRTVEDFLELIDVSLPQGSLLPIVFLGGNHRVDYALEVLKFLL